jgi:hypothetical protein
LSEADYPVSSEWPHPIVEVLEKKIEVPVGSRNVTRPVDF